MKTASQFAQFFLHHAYNSEKDQMSNLKLQKLSDSQLTCSENNDDHHAYQYDVNTMQDSIDSGSVPVPDFETNEEFIAWLNA